MKRFCFSVVFLCVFSLCAEAETSSWWVFFSDRGPRNVAKEIAAKVSNPADPKNTGGRAKMPGGALFDERDLPVNLAYISAVAELAPDVRTVSRWFNGVSVDADGETVRKIARLPFVRTVRPVAGFRRPREPLPGNPPPPAGKAAGLSYGRSFDQMNLAGIVKLHERGYFGDGVRIGLLDSGFDNLNHPAFDSLTVSHRWDFVGRDGDVGGDDHGTEVLSVLAAAAPGSMIGAAPHATYLLARTEIINDEDVKAEEDYWVAALEWADSLGADIVSSSLGYNTFADGKSYTYADLDGATAITTIAADIAVDRGMAVVVSAGNEGDKPWYHVVTPADGKRVIAVGSVRLDEKLQPVVSAFSSRGPTFDGRMKPDFVALGENVTVAKGIGTGYLLKNGTSYAAPAVAGAAALLLQIHPGWSPVVLYDSLKVTAHRAGPDSLAGHGLVDAFAASGLSDGGQAVEGFVMYDPYPQPAVFGGGNGTRVYFPMDVPVGGKTLTIDIFSFSGATVRKIEGVISAPGSYRDRIGAPNWDGKNFTGDPVAPGVYYYAVRLDGYGRRTGKIAVLR